MINGVVLQKLQSLDEVLTERPVFCRDVGRRAEFVSLTAREYEDAMGMLRRAMARRERMGS